MPRRPQARAGGRDGAGGSGGGGQFPSTSKGVKTTKTTTTKTTKTTRETATEEGGGARAAGEPASKKVIDDSGAATSSRAGTSSSNTHVTNPSAQKKDGLTWKRKATLPNGERKPYYCFSCKQALKPGDFDPGLETCRICLAKRRAKDREKKRLRAMHLKHHLLSADEKEVAAFLLGVYHPAVHRPPDNPRQMHMQVSLNVTEFVNEFKDILKGKSREQADCVVSTFLGRKPETKTRKSSKKVSEVCDDGVRSKSTKVTPRKRRLLSTAPKFIMTEEDSAFSSGAADNNLEYEIDAVYKRYTSVLEKSMDQTWVRFAREDEANESCSLGIGVDVMFTRPVHEQDQDDSHKSSRSASMALECPTSDMFSSIMHGADPMVSEFLHEFLFTSNEERVTVIDEPWMSAADARADDDAQAALVPKEEASDNYLYDYNTIEEFQQDGSAYVFKGSLVMGWIGGTIGSANAGMLSSDNGVLPDTLHPQALSRDGKIFDARTPGALVPLKETEHLRGFDEDIECYPVIDSVSSDIRITLPRESFSEELGIRALHDGKYIECEVFKNEETVDIFMYPNGKQTPAIDASAGVVLLGVVYLQCFVCTGAAKQLPIGMNLPVLLLPNAACAEEVRYGVEQILKLRSRREARQFIVSLGIALQNGDTKSTKFSFVLEMSYILKLKRTLNMLELVASLAKLPSPGSSPGETDSESSKLGKEVLDAITVTMLADYRDKVATMYRPGVCVAVGLVHLFASPSKLHHSMLDAVHAFVILLSAAVLSIALSKRQAYELDVVAISALFAFSQAALLHSAPLFDSSDIQCRIIAYVYAVITTWLLTIMHSMQSFAGILAANTIPIVIFSWIGFAPSTLTKFLVAAWPQDMYLPPLAIIVHGIVTHFCLSSLGPMLFTGLIRKSISWYVETNYNSSSHLTRLQKRYAHSRSHSFSQQTHME